jgi:hypothetical protein
MTDDKLKPCREAFEAAFCHLDLTRYTDGDGYNSKITNRTWKGWKTAWNTRPPSEALRLAKEALVEIEYLSRHSNQLEAGTYHKIAEDGLAAIEKEGV